MLSLFVALVGYAAFALSSKATKSVSASELRFQAVESGALEIYTNVYGEFVSAQERLLTAPASGKVSAILVRPGTAVTPETVILQLSNPKLEQEVSQAKGLLAQQQAEQQAFKYEQQSERLNYQGRIADIEADIEKAALELSVNEDLLSLGVSAKIEFKRAQLLLKQENKRLLFEQQKYQQFIEMQGFQFTQRDITVKQQMSQVALLEEQLNNMRVKAGIIGSLQTLDIELGQSVQLGESLAKVGSNKHLIARIRLPQNQADQIDINAPVIIDTQKGTIAAHISRIESVVTSGSVIAEVVLDGELTSNARPALAISAKVFVKHEKNAIFIKQVPGFRPSSKQSLFVKSGDDVLVQRNVVFGGFSQNNIIIKEGLAVGDEIVTNDTSMYKNYSELTIEN